MQTKDAIDLPWCDPLCYAIYLNLEHAEEDFAFLYSARSTFYSGRYSYIGCAPRTVVTDANQWQDSFKDQLWLGYIGYEAFMGLSPGKRFIDSPDLYLVIFDKIIIFDHALKRCYLCCGSAHPLRSSIAGKLIEGAKTFRRSRSDVRLTVDSLHSNMDRAQQLDNIQRTIEATLEGEFYQANITRKFYGHLNQMDSEGTFDTFTKLCALSPNPYCSFLRLGGQTVLSASPEMFLKIDSEGLVTTNPIKGTSTACKDPIANERAKKWLMASQKNFAENLMIVDLMRNDLAINCLTGSIKVPRFYQICSYPNVHHALSTVTGRIQPAVSIPDFISSCFPPGSMTGAPKARVVEWCRAIEKMDRGIYSGCIGWFDGNNNTMEAAVTIRTLIISSQNQWETQVGGAILAKSDPAEELAEAAAKVKPIFELLHITQ